MPLTRKTCALSSLSVWHDHQRPIRRRHVGHVPASRPAVRHYLIQCPLGMLADGHKIKRFTSLQAFEGYIVQLTKLGMTVHWSSPFTATALAAV